LRLFSFYLDHGDHYELLVTEDKTNGRLQVPDSELDAAPESYLLGQPKVISFDGYRILLLRTKCGECRFVTVIAVEQDCVFIGALTDFYERSLVFFLSLCYLLMLRDIDEVSFENCTSMMSSTHVFSVLEYAHESQQLLRKMGDPMIDDVINNFRNYLSVSQQLRYAHSFRMLHSQSANFIPLYFKFQVSENEWRWFKVNAESTYDAYYDAKIICVLYEDVTAMHQLELQLEETIADMSLASRLLGLHEYSIKNNCHVHCKTVNLLTELGYRSRHHFHPDLLLYMHPADVRNFRTLQEGDTVTVRLKANTDTYQWRWYKAVCTKTQSYISGFLFSVQELTHLQSECQITRACFKITNSVAFWAINLSNDELAHPIFETKSLEYLRKLFEPNQQFPFDTLDRLETVRHVEIKMKLLEFQPYEWYSITFMPSRSQQVLCFVFNINERKRTYDLLQQTEELLNLAFTYSDVRMWTFDDTHREDFSIVTSNTDSLIQINMDWSTLEHNVTFEFQKVIEQAFLQALNDHTSLEIEVPFFFDSVRWLLLRGIAVEDNGKRRLIGIFVDLTAIKEATAELEHEKAAAEEALMAKSTFLANVTHEIRAPLNGICGLLEMLRALNLPSDQLEFVSVIQKSFYELNELLNDILDLAKLESNKLIRISERFDPCQVLSALTDTMYNLKNCGNIQFRVWTDPNQPILYMGDPHCFQRIVMPIISNSLKFTKAGAIEVKIMTQDDFLVVELIDTGIGMNSITLQGIRNHFKRDDTFSVYENICVGLGYSLVTELIKFVKGKIQIDSKENEGTIVKIALPWEPVYYPWVNPNRKGNVRSLILIDDDYNRNLVESYQKFYRYHVSIVDNLEEVVQLKNWDLLCLQCNGMFEFLSQDINNFSHGVVLCFSKIEPPQILQKKIELLQSSIRIDEIRNFLTKFAFGKNHREKRISGNLSTPDNLGFKVLVVDDSQTNLLIMSTMLKKLGCISKAVVNGEEAIEQLNAEVFDLVLMDRNMPVLDGPSATRRIRQENNQCPDIPIIAMTASNLQEDEKECLQAGMNGFLSKPATLKQLANVLQKFVRK